MNDNAKPAWSLFDAMSKIDPNWNAYGRSRESAAYLAHRVTCDMQAASMVQADKQCPRCRGVGSYGEPPIACQFCKLHELGNKLHESQSEPTPAMQQAGVRELRNDYWGGADYGRVCAIWRAMTGVAASEARMSPEAAALRVLLDAVPPRTT